MKADSLAALPDAIASACLRACNGDGPMTRETMRHLLNALNDPEKPLTPESAKLIAQLYEKLEASLDPR